MHHKYVTCTEDARPFANEGKEQGEVGLPAGLLLAIYSFATVHRRQQWVLTIFIFVVAPNTLLSPAEGVSPTSNEQMRNVLRDETLAIGVPIPEWDVKEVTDMSVLFVFSAFNEDINCWNTAQVIDMSYMFRGASSFNQPVTRHRSLACLI